MIGKKCASFFFSALRIWQLLEVRRGRVHQVPPGLLPASVGPDELLVLPGEHHDGRRGRHGAHGLQT